MQTIDHYQNAFLKHLKSYNFNRKPQRLYQPIQYILGLGGKRLRPILTLIAADIFNADYHTAMPAALCIEVFHNFSLVHDDIMDAAPLRRGQKTVHEKWDINTGILSGDAMLIMAYQLLENYDAKTFKALAKLFSKTAIEVCEGQQYDIDFETRKDVSISEYLKMIEYKTAVLIGAALQMGAIVAKASKTDQHAIYDFGRYLGIAFQLQDDYLDTFGNPETFGKQVGGDIIENKKTYLYLKTITLSNHTTTERIQKWFDIQPSNPSEKIKAVKQLYLNSGAATTTKEAVESYTLKAFEVLKTLNISDQKKALLKQFGTWLMSRNV